jgi:hypothetical protein
VGAASVDETLMRPMLVVEVLEFAQCRRQVGLVPDQGTVQQLVAAGLHPPTLRSVVAFILGTGFR